MGTPIHGGDIVSARERITGRIIDFSANLNPMGMPPGVVRALQEATPEFAAYPDPQCRALTARLAEVWQVPKEYIVCGNGAADMIYRLVYALRPRKAMIVVPTFTEYQQALESIGCAIAHHHVWATSNFVLTDSILKNITSELDVVFLCNPNNPTGHVADQTLMRKILARCVTCGVLLVVDECFNEFLDDGAEDSVIDLTSSFPNLFVLRAFTKIYAMAGLRLGYCVCSHGALLERMKMCGQPWSVSTPAQIAGLAALDDQRYLQATHRLIAEERDYLINALTGLGFKVIGSKANFIFFKLSCTMPPLVEQLEEKGIVVRTCEDFVGLDENYYRIAVRTHEENSILIQALAEILSKPEMIRLPVEE